MEPISLLIAALVAGATKAASDVVPDSYNVLKTLIKGKFAGNSTAEMVLTEHEKDPRTYTELLKKQLAKAGADRDQEIIKLAQDLLNQLQEQPSLQQIITQNISNVKYAATSASGNVSISSITEYGTSKDNK